MHGDDVRIAVFGASGTVGRTLCRKAQSSGIDVVSFSGHTDKNSERFRLESPDFGLLGKHIKGVTAAFICAAVSSIDACKKDEKYSRKVNVEGTLLLADWLYQHGIKVIFYSSDYVFSGAVGNYLEEDAPDPTTVYGSQKAETERKLLQLVPDALILRLSKVVSGDPCDRTMFSEWYDKIQKEEIIYCVSDQWFCPVASDQVASASLFLMKKGANGIFHVCGREKYNRIKLLGEFVEILGIKNVRAIECRTSDMAFVDKRSYDTSMNSLKLRQTGYMVSSISDAIKNFGINVGRY